MALYLPIDAVTGRSPDLDLAADYLELNAFFSPNSAAQTSGLRNAMSLAAEEDHGDLDRELQRGEAEEVVASAVSQIKMRQDALDTAYPFALDEGGDVLTCVLEVDSFGQAAYILSLVLSNLFSVSEVLSGSGYHPDDTEVRKLRQYFQYMATAALAAEVQGEAWSFGSPRPDGSPFLEKLRQIWKRLGDGQVEAQPGSPRQPKDDQVDVFAARRRWDRLPGFILAAAQVATGKNAREKSLKGHLDAFKERWFSRRPLTNFIPYWIVPFAADRDQFVDDVRTMGNCLASAAPASPCGGG